MIPGGCAKLIGKRALQCIAVLIRGAGIILQIIEVNLGETKGQLPFRFSRNHIAGQQSHVLDPALFVLFIKGDDFEFKRPSFVEEITCGEPPGDRFERPKRFCKLSCFPQCPGGAEEGIVYQFIFRKITDNGFEKILSVTGVVKLSKINTGSPKKDGGCAGISRILIPESLRVSGHQVEVFNKLRAVNGTCKNSPPINGAAAVLHRPEVPLPGLSGIPETLCTPCSFKCSLA